MKRKTMIFAAGLGTRLAPLTNHTPKALVDLNGKPLLWHVTKKIIDEGFNQIVINVHHFAQQIKDYVKTEEYLKLVGNTVIKISDESLHLLNTGGGLRFAAPLLFDDSTTPVLIHNVDIISNANLSELYDSLKEADALLLVSKRQTNRYLLFNEQMHLVGWTNISTGEVKSPYPELKIENCKMFAFSGIHVVSKHLTDEMHNWPDAFGIMDFYISQCLNMRIQGVVQDGLQITDIGKNDTLNKLRNSL